MSGLREHPRERLWSSPLHDAGIPGYLNGRHHSAYVSTIRAIKTTGHVWELEDLLLRLVEATEAEAHHTGCAVMSSYYRELARMYRKAQDVAKEHAILARFARQTHAPGASAARLVARLPKARAALADVGVPAKLSDA